MMYDDDSWYSDSGVTHNITNDFNNIYLHSEYQGNDTLKDGNDSGLQIHNVGMICIPKAHFLLKDVLHVPYITKNFMLVNKLTRDNNLFVEFHPYYCYIKDKALGRLIASGKSDRDLYRNSLQVGQNKEAMVGEYTMFDQWHQRLGHPSSKIVQDVLR
jgi:hypothetical protein